MVKNIQTLSSNKSMTRSTSHQEVQDFGKRVRKIRHIILVLVSRRLKKKRRMTKREHQPSAPTKIKKHSTTPSSNVHSSLVMVRELLLQMSTLIGKIILSLRIRKSKVLVQVTTNMISRIP